MLTLLKKWLRDWQGKKAYWPGFQAAQPLGLPCKQPGEKKTKARLS
jgi:hypothetical protein